MAGRASDCAESLLADQHRCLNFGIVWNHATRHRHGCLKDRNGRHISARHLIHHAVAVRVGILPESLCRLNTVVMIEALFENCRIDTTLPAW